MTAGFPVPITARLFDTDGLTEIEFTGEAGVSALRDAFGLTFLDELDGPGTGSGGLQLTDINAAQIIRGRHVAFYLDWGDGPERCFTIKLRGKPQYELIGEGEEAAEFLTFEGEGWGVTAGEATVHREVSDSIPRELDYSYRLFSFASFYWNDLAQFAGWGTSAATYEYRDLAEGSVRGRLEAIVDDASTPDDQSDDVVNVYVAPIGWPWAVAPHNGDGTDPTPVYSPTNWMIDGDTAENAIGTHFCRGYFTLSGEQLVTFLVTADNLFTLYLQGVPILGENADMYAWSGYWDATLLLPAGLYVIGFAVENIDIGIDNPGGGLFNAIALSTYPDETQPSLTLALLSSGEGWDSTFSNGDWPGWTAGQILARLFSEAQARGALQSMDASPLTCGALVDSDGNDWNTADPDTDTLYIPTFETKLMNDYLSVLDELVQQGWIEWHARPDVLQLDVFTPGGVGNTPGVTFQRSDNSTVNNIIHLSRGETKPYANYLQVQWSGGFTTVKDQDEIDAYGSQVEDGYECDAKTEAEAQRLGRVELYRRMLAADSAVLMTIEPRSAADCPYAAFEVRDNVTIPDAAMSGSEQVRVLSISCTQDDDGDAVFVLELNERWRFPEREEVDLLRSIGGKSMGSVSDHGAASD